MRLVLALLLLAPSAHSLTLSDIRTDCRVLIQDTGSTRNRFTDAILLRFINEGQKDLVQSTKPIRKHTSFELVSGTTYYSAPSDFIVPIRITRSYQLLPELSVASLDKQISWQTVGGLPINYYVNHSSRTLIGFYPFPNTTNSTGTIRMEYSAQATDLSSDSDSPFNAITELQQYGYALSLFCAYRGQVLNGNMAIAQAYYAEYTQLKNSLASDAFSRPNYKPGAVGAGVGGVP